MLKGGRIRHQQNGGHQQLPPNVIEYHQLRQRFQAMPRTKNRRRIDHHLNGSALVWHLGRLNAIALVQLGLPNLTFGTGNQHLYPHRLRMMTAVADVPAADGHLVTQLPHKALAILRPKVRVMKHRGGAQANFVRIYDGQLALVQFNGASDFGPNGARIDGAQQPTYGQTDETGRCHRGIRILRYQHFDADVVAALEGPGG